jgi:hypothetical protein
MLRGRGEGEESLVMEDALLQTSLGRTMEEALREALQSEDEGKRIPHDKAVDVYLAFEEVSHDLHLLLWLLNETESRGGLLRC